ncbi:hypothetical protein PV379_04405 [Streptomyces caniscabiei]|uniref:hypothetical protein n=1 Tax=Streptomyces caniscabiei TaxID=2746961 RepID=UPI0029B1C37E|nr:hypothetical protein [Streptomyces caniscabiei]MDX2776579.1 hypothetical protein [Streptomyces caniscabiei]
MMKTLPLSEIRHCIDGVYYKYGFVGSGAQFRVYAVYTNDGRPTGRVVKVPLDFDETRQAIMDPLRRLDQHKTEEELDELADKRTHEVMQYKYDVPRLMQGVLGRDKNFRHKLGNLRILQVPLPVSNESTGAYYLPTLFTQDYVVTLDEYLRQFRLAANPYATTLEMQTIRQLKKVIDQVITLNFAIWEYGIFEFVFKPENFGIRISSKGETELIWIDLAEHITDMKKSEEVLRERRWRHAVMPHKVDYQFMPTVLHDYYVGECDKFLTVDNFHKYWRRKADRAERLQARILHIKELMSHDDKKAVGHWIARHTLAQSLYQGFTPETIDNMQLPISDIEQLVRDRSYARFKKTVSVEERMERQMAESDTSRQTVVPLVVPPLLGERKNL